MDREKLIDGARQLMNEMGVDGVVILGINKARGTVERAFVDLSVIEGLGLMSLVKAEATALYVSTTGLKKEQPPQSPQQPQQPEPNK